MKESLFQYIKNRILIIGMVAGVSSYLIYMQLPVLHPAGPVLELVCRKAQPALLFCMLFISFSRIEPKELRLCRWHGRNILLQVGLYMTFFALIVWSMHTPQTELGAWVLKNRILFESAMLCIICPTATACAVVTGKLGGDMAQVVTYTIIVNLVTSIIVPVTVPLLYPQSHIVFIEAFGRIISKVFPLLILPCLAAWTVRYIMPRVHDWVASKMNLSFYLWSIALTLAILTNTKAIVHSKCSLLTLIEVAIVSLLCCLLQFYIGKRNGAEGWHRIESSQALGQKNTVFAIWMGYTFWNPLTSVAAGFYTIWHNIHNTRQLYKAGKR